MRHWKAQIKPFESRDTMYTIDSGKEKIEAVDTTVQSFFIVAMKAM